MNLAIRSMSLVRTVYQHPYNRLHPLSAVWRIAKWQVGKRLAGCRGVVFRLWPGRRVICYPDSVDSMWLVYNVVMDWEEFHFIARYLREGDAVFDVGANIGAYAVWISRFLGQAGRLFAFEPDPLAFERCRKQMALNGLRNVIVENAALADRVGTRPFSTGLDWQNHLYGDFEKASSSIEARTITLDGYCRERGIDKVSFMKIDVEGAEMLVFKGGEKTLSRAVDVVQFEMTDQMRRFGFERADVLRWLRNHGFTIGRYSIEKNQIEPLGESTAFPQNLWAVKNVWSANKRLKEKGFLRVA